MEDNQKYNKRRRSYTEFRTSYSDNKKYFISTDHKRIWMPILKYIIIIVAMLVFAFAGFLITDALLNISEEPYVETTTKEVDPHAGIDESYFNNLVTSPAKENDNDSNNSSLE